MSLFKRRQPTCLRKMAVSLFRCLPQEVQASAKIPLPVTPNLSPESASAGQKAAAWCLKPIPHKPRIPFGLPQMPVALALVWALHVISSPINARIRDPLGLKRGSVGPVSPIWPAPADPLLRNNGEKQTGLENRNPSDTFVKPRDHT